MQMHDSANLCPWRITQEYGKRRTAQGFGAVALRRPVMSLSFVDTAQYMFDVGRRARETVSSNEAVGIHDITRVANVAGVLDRRFALFFVMWKMMPIHVNVDQCISAFVTFGGRTIFVSNSAALTEQIVS